MPKFKSDKVCKHTVAVAEKSGILRQHLGHICKDQGQKGASRTALQKCLGINLLPGRKAPQTSFIIAPIMQTAQQTTPYSHKSHLTTQRTFTVKYTTMTIHLFYVCCLLKRKPVKAASTTFVTGRKQAENNAICTQGTILFSPSRRLEKQNSYKEGGNAILSR